MDSAFLIHNVVPLRAEPRGGGEQVSQGILGDPVQILEVQGDYARVRTADAYAGWALAAHLQRYESANTRPLEVSAANRVARLISADFSQGWTAPDRARQVTKLVWGSRVEVACSVETPAGRCALLQRPGSDDPLCYVLESTLSRLPGPAEFDGGAACDLAVRFIGTPYLWGGGTPFGFDCSGYVQRIYSVLGVVIPRDAYLQADSPLGTWRGPEWSTSAGDLVFFGGPNDPRSRGIIHVGMAMDAGTFIHASGRTGVTVSKFDDRSLTDIYERRGSWRLNSH